MHEKPVYERIRGTRKAEFTGNLVHVRDHQQQTLRSSVSCSQRTGLQRTVNGTGSHRLRIAFLYQYCFAEDVLRPAAAHSSTYSAIVEEGDGIDGSYFGEHIRDMCAASLITICDEFLLFSHN